MSDRISAIDLFAGTGWGVACKELGIDEVGVELMPEARATREANGMRNWLADVWDVLATADPDSPEFKAALLIASPPCQSFSMAGKGEGRRALTEVLGLIDSGAYLDVSELRAFGERHDMRTALVLTPLTYVAQHRPPYVVLEQVPQVLPVWERMAVELRGWGYSVVTAVLNSEQFGVPQTRKRAILIARSDGVEARMPTPTHSRYYPRDKARMDLGVLPWVSMAEALGWNLKPGEVTVRTSMGAPKVDGRNGTHELDPATRPMHTVTTKIESVRVMRSNYGTGGDPSLQGERTGDEPSATVTSKIDRNIIMVSNDKFAHSASRNIDEPAPTITAGHDSGNRRWVASKVQGTGRTERYGERRPRELDEPAFTVRANAGGAEPGGFRFVHAVTGDPINLDPSLPATTVAGDRRLSSREHHAHGEQNSTSTKVTVAEAAALQSYPADFDWTPVVPVLRKGVDTGRTKPMGETKAYQQIGNAVPPLLAQAVLGTIVDDSGVR